MSARERAPGRRWFDGTFDPGPLPEGLDPEHIATSRPVSETLDEAAFNPFALAEVFFAEVERRQKWWDREFAQFDRWTCEVLAWTPRLPARGERLPRKLKKRMAKAGRFERWAGSINCSHPSYVGRIAAVRE